LTLISSCRSQNKVPIVFAIGDVVNQKVQGVILHFKEFSKKDAISKKLMKK